MTYPGVRRANKRQELDRGTWADRTPMILTYDFTGPGTLTTTMQPFTVVYEGYPDFSYGVELIEGQVLTPGDFPMVNAGVAVWDQTFPEDGSLPRIKGAQVFLVVQCAAAYQLRFRFLFQGAAYRNPTLLGVLGTPAP